MHMLPPPPPIHQWPHPPIIPILCMPTLFFCQTPYAHPPLYSYAIPSSCTQLPSAPDLRRVEVDRHSILSCGGVTLQGLRDLLAHLGAGPQGSNHVVMTDLREELVVYINGVPYTRRELEMPVAALHHAGVHAAQ
eukprot:1138848-Pelagomonas_calceolata.AAC.21